MPSPGIRYVSPRIVSTMPRNQDPFPYTVPGRTTMTSRDPGEAASSPASSASRLVFDSPRGSRADPSVRTPGWSAYTQSAGSDHESSGSDRRRGDRQVPGPVYPRASAPSAPAGESG